MTSTYHPSTRVSTDIATNSSALGMNQRYLQIGRTLLLVYAVLWVIEGALRKWVFLSLSDALLIIRDPVVISIYYVTYKAHCFPKNILSNLFTGLGVVLLVVGLLLQPEFPVTILYGFRVDFLYMPLIFVHSNGSIDGFAIFTTSRLSVECWCWRRDRRANKYSQRTHTTARHVLVHIGTGMPVLAHTRLFDK